MQLANQLSNDRPIYALDDRVIESGISLSFHSITEVAIACLSVIQTILDTTSNSDSVVIDVGGWSYGGVVAVEVAKQLLNNNNKNIIVRNIIMFDSPLRSAVVTSSNSTDDSSNNSVGKAHDSSSNPTMVHAERHFQECTRLLRLYHQRPKEEKPLTCTILAIRPNQAEYEIEHESIEELTSGKIVYDIVPGTHWTMLYDENVLTTAKIVNEFLDSCSN
jgi:thioesterase domain-containing protein